MKEINISVSGLDIDSKAASHIATCIARLQEAEPVIVAWHDRPAKRMSPIIEGADIHTRWRDYGQSHGGDVLISINGDYDFIFADASAYQGEGPGPFVTVRDKQGNEYLCLVGALKDPNNPSEQACYKLSELDFGA
ncbi:MAG: hypothetical protein D6819_10545 [Gammaproteobacteria bacterium]|nr:MAG: hypothetical protein D6819_10545 [Gammaproteobacteria bacterium]